MADEETILKIEIPVEEEVPFIPERTRPDVKTGVLRAGQKVVKTSTDAAGRAWRSETRRKAAAGVGRGTARVAEKGSQIVRERIVKTAGRQARQRSSAMASRIKSTDWKGETKAGTANGLRWLSRHLAQLAERFTPSEPAPTQKPVQLDGERR